MTLAVPLRYEGEGQFQALKGHVKICDKELVIGEILTWQDIKPRSKKSHDHFFALVDEVWATLPEDLVKQYPNAEIFRKRILIKAGFCTQSQFVFFDNREAIAACAFMSRMDRYALFQVNDAVVTVWNADSQSVKAMGAKQFQKSKEAVLHVISELIGADVTEQHQVAA